MERVITAGEWTLFSPNEVPELHERYGDAFRAAYEAAEARAAAGELRHRPVGLGMMGFADALHRLGIAYASDAAVDFADRSMELICHTAYWASTELAAERGRYSSYQGSLWDRGILPHDSIDLLASTRRPDHAELALQLDRSSQLDWSALRQRIARHGMRNSNCVAIAPTATIANITGVSASIEPDYQNLYVKSNLSGEFTMINAHLFAELKALDLWDEVMAADLKYFDGSLAAIERVMRADFDLRDRDNLHEFALSYLFFAAIFEGCWFYNGFSPIFALQRRGLMKGTAEQLQYIMRDEVLHCAFGIRTVRTLIEEENLQLDPQAIAALWLEAEAAESAYSDFLLPEPILGYSAAQHMGQFRYIANRRARQLGVAEPFPGASNVLPWLDEQANLRKEKNFFETRVTEYQTGGALSWD
jgi:hypothetical protein